MKNKFKIFSGNFDNGSVDFYIPKIKIINNLEKINMASTYLLPVMESEVRALVKSKYYPSRIEVLKDALRTLFETKPDLKILAALEMYRDNEVSLSRAAEIAGVTTVEFKEILANRGGALVSEAKSTGEVDKKAEKLSKYLK